MGKKRKKYHDDYEDDYYEEEDISAEEVIRKSFVNETLVNSFVNEYQPEFDERKPYVIALSMGQLRELMQIYRTFDDKMPDPLPFYIERLKEDGFSIRMGFANEIVMLVSRRNNGKGLHAKEVDEDDDSF